MHRCIHNLLLKKHILFVLATILSITIAGYYFGTMDQASHIPFLKKYSDNTLFPSDHFFDLRYTHYSYFWFFFIPFYRLGVLEITMFIAYIIAMYATFWGIWQISYTLFKDKFISGLSVLTFIIPHICFAGFPLIEFSLLNRTFVLPFLLFAIDLYLHKKYYRSFLLLGLLYNLHVISVNFALALLLFNSVLEIKKIGIKTLLLSLLLFVCMALPVLLWKLGTSHIDLSVHYEWFSIISKGMLYNIFYFIAPYSYILIFTLNGISTIALFFIARNNTSQPSFHLKTVTNFIYAALIILLVELITAYVYPATIIVQSQIIRVGLFILLFGYMYFISYLVARYRAGKLSKTDFYIIMISLVFSGTPLIPLILIALSKLIRYKPLRTLLSLFTLMFCVVGFMALAYVMGAWRPGVYIFPPHTDWYKVQVWARDHTSKETVFITPPQIWWLYDVEWRVISERSTVVTLSELLEAAFAPEYIPYWKERFNDIAPGALREFKGNIYENILITKKSFYSHSARDFKKLGNKYHAQFLVVEKPYFYNFPLVYENKQFRVYELER